MVINGSYKLIFDHKLLTWKNIKTTVKKNIVVCILLLILGFLFSWLLLMILICFVIVKCTVTYEEKHIDSNNDGKCDICGEKTGEVTPPLSNPSSTCTHICHKSGFAGFIYKIARFFWKLFKIHQTCECGAKHY